MYHLKNIISYISFLMILSCNRKEHINYLKFDQNGLCVLTDWYMVGPFKYDTIKQKPWETFSNRDLAQYSINEDSFKVDDLEILKKIHKDCNLVKKFATHNLVAYIDTIADKSNCYLATVLKSDKESDLVLLADGAACYKIWLNQEMIYQIRSNPNIAKIANRFIPVHIKKGNNIFLAKVNREANKHAWGLYLALASQMVAAEIFHYNYMNDFVTNPIVLDTLTFYSGSLKVEKSEIFSYGIFR